MMNVVEEFGRNLFAFYKKVFKVNDSCFICINDDIFDFILNYSCISSNDSKDNFWNKLKELKCKPNNEFEALAIAALQVKLFYDYKAESFRNSDNISVLDESDDNEECFIPRVRDFYGFSQNPQDCYNNLFNPRRVVINAYQDILWKNVSDLFKENGMVLNIPQPRTGQGRYSQYPQSQCRFLNCICKLFFFSSIKKNPFLFEHDDYVIENKADFENKLVKIINKIKSVRHHGLNLSILTDILDNNSGVISFSAFQLFSFLYPKQTEEDIDNFFRNYGSGRNYVGNINYSENEDSHIILREIENYVNMEIRTDKRLESLDDLRTFLIDRLDYWNFFVFAYDSDNDCYIDVNPNDNNNDIYLMVSRSCNEWDCFSDYECKCGVRCSGVKIEDYFEYFRLYKIPISNDRELYNRFCEKLLPICPNIKYVGGIRLKNTSIWLEGCEPVRDYMDNPYDLDIKPGQITQFISIVENDPAQSDSDIDVENLVVGDYGYIKLNGFEYDSSIYVNNDSDFCEKPDDFFDKLLKLKNPLLRNNRDKLKRAKEIIYGR